MSSYNSQNTSYIGRFAPTPTGPLHMGSLVAALASFLDARSNNGKWLLRIDDIDPPREMEGAANSIIKCLQDFELFWDDEIVYQSKQGDLYQKYLDQLKGQTYSCVCSRKQIGKNPYKGTCFAKQVDSSVPSSIRFRVQNEIVEFEDCIQSSQKTIQDEDFVIKRKDNLWAYHLAVVVDDYLSGVTDVVRGIDLMDSSFRHIQLQNALGFEVPKYAHIPVVVEKNGQKLSKQNLAAPIGVDPVNRLNELKVALGFLDINVDGSKCIEDALQSAVKKWKMDSLKGRASIEVS